MSLDPPPRSIITATATITTLPAMAPRSLPVERSMMKLDHAATR
jgi:hypothetical protein